MSEEMNSQVPEVQALVPKTVRVESEDLKLWNQVRQAMEDQSGHKVTDTAVFGEVMNRYFAPIKQNGDLAELRAKLEAKESEVASLTQKLEEAQRMANSNAEAANAQQMQHEARVAELTAAIDQKSLKEGEHVVLFRPGYYEVLQRVAEIEGARRGQPWTVSDVICFFAYARFVKGELNGNLRSLPDGECRKIEQQLGISFDPKRKAAPSQKKEVEL